MQYALLALALYLFWLLLSGHYSLLLLVLGLLSALLSTYVLRRMDRTDEEPSLFVPRLGLLRYAAWLMWQVIKSNVDVARRIWHPRMPVSPAWGRLDVDLKTPLQITLYANSITLTPGTLTTDVRDGYFLVHALNEESIEELRQGEMECQILRSGI